jgi:glycosyltransferase involved in cell wall biosynthesis
MPEVSSGFNYMALRAEIGTAPEDTVIVQVSRLLRLKGQTNLIAALAQLKDRPNWTCWLVGGVQRESELEYASALRRQAVECGIGDRVRFVGERRDIADVLAAADVYCQFNASPEPFGITLIEALYSGLQVVTSGFGGAAEIVTPDCGTLVTPHDTAALASALREFIGKPRRNHDQATAGRARAFALCSPVRQINALNAALMQAVAGPPGGI